MSRPPRRSTPARIRALTDLAPDPHNANRGTVRGRALLADSLKMYGPGRAILIDRAGRIIAGNKTAEQAKALGLPLRVVKTDGTHLIAVQRDDLDLTRDARAQALAVADNRVGELDLEWDPAVLAQLKADGLDLDAFWTPEEFAALIGDALTDAREENAVIAPGPTDIVLGDQFVLGRHHVRCGDATNAADVARLLGDAVPVLMATDAPYGVRYQPAWRHAVDPRQRTAVGRVANDDRADWREAFALFPGDVLYAWHAGLRSGTVATAIEAAGFVIRSQIIWSKQHFALSRADYHFAHEPAFYAVRKGKTSHWRGDRRQTTVWDVPNLNPLGGTRTGDNAVTGHATQKPVKLFEIPILNHTTTHDAVMDPFCGSGTAVIAAEKTGRTCFAMDIDPQYVQVTVTRWETFTGQRARRDAARGTTTRRSR